MAPGNPWPSWTGCVALGTSLFLAHEMGNCVVSRGLTRVFSFSESDREHFADLLLSKHFRTFMLAASWNGTKNVGVSFYGRCPKPPLHPSLTPGPPLPGLGSPEPQPTLASHLGLPHPHLSPWSIL